MSGTLEGGLKARDKNLAKDPNFYKTIGALGGRAGNTGGFAAKIPCFCDDIQERHHRGQCAGKKGGVKSRRGTRQSKTNQEPSA